jgi:hypothetical protein
VNEGRSDDAPRAPGSRRRSARGARTAFLAVLLLLAALAAASEARADGDPASDYLVTQNVFLSYTSPSTGDVAALANATGAVYGRGERVKVALIFDVQDLGSIPSLFGQPGNYAQFLGLELGLWYKGPLLVVMPAGFGFYDDGRSTVAAEQVLQSISVDGSSPDGLAQSATTAVDQLLAAGALTSPDTEPPLVTAHPADATLGRPATLHFDLYDDSGRASAVVRIYERSSLLATLKVAAAFSIGTRDVAVQWPVPAKLASHDLRFCVVATDPSGNRSRPACALFLRVTGRGAPSPG